MDFDFNYKIKGEGNPLFFQHGLGANLKQAQGLLSEIEGHQIISMDCPGHGKSVLTADYTPSFDNYSDEVIRLMDHLKIKRATFGGISMGAGISLNIALRYPERVEKLIFVRPAWLAKGRPKNLLILLKIAHLIGHNDGQEQFEEMEDFQKIKDELPNAAASIMGMFSRDQGVATQRILRKMVNDAPFSDLNALENIEQPCLSIGNDDDPLHPLSMAISIYNALGNSKLKKVTSRYINNSKHKKEVTEAVSSFLSQ